MIAKFIFGTCIITSCSMNALAGPGEGGGDGHGSRPWDDVVPEAAVVEVIGDLPDDADQPCASRYRELFPECISFEHEK